MVCVDAVRHLAFLFVLLAGCRYLSAPTPQVAPGRDALLSGGNPADPTRQPSQLPERKCVVECGARFHCDERTARCEPDAPGEGARDGGPAWLP